MESIEDRLRDSARLAGLEVYDQPETLIVSGASLESCIDLLAQSNVVILGLEGFNQRQDMWIPVMDQIADFSELDFQYAERVKESAQAARRVISNWGLSADWVEVVVADEELLKRLRS